VELGTAGIESDRFTEVLFGLLQAVEREQYTTEIVAAPGVPGIALEGLFDQTDGFVAVALLMAQDAQKLQRVRVLGLDGKNRPVALLRLFQRTRLVPVRGGTKDLKDGNRSALGRGIHALAGAIACAFTRLFAYRLAQDRLAP